MNSPDKSLTKLKSNSGCDLKNTNNDKEYECPHCNTVFNRKDNLTRHIDKYCKTKLAAEQEKQQLTQMQEMIVKLSEELNIVKQAQTNTPNSVNVNSNNNSNNNNSINSNNQTVNIQLVAFGKEDRSKLTEFEILKIMKRGYESIPELIKLINFDKDKPENHNIYISNKKEKDIHIFDGEKWKVVDRTKTIDNLFDDGRNFLLSKLEELNERDPPLGKITRISADKFERINDEIDEYPDRKNDVFKSIINMLYNERAMVIKSRKEFEVQQLNLLA